MHSNKLTIFTVLFCVGISITAVHSIKLEQKYVWKELEFAWPSNEAKSDALSSGRYQPGNNLPLGLDIWHDKLFLTVPRWKAGVAASLNYIQLSDEPSPVLHPYPNWESHNLSGNDFSGESSEEENDEKSIGNTTIISPYRISVDACDRLWVMDSGQDALLDNVKIYSRPSLLVFDLRTDQLLRRYEFSIEHASKGEHFNNVVIDVQKDDCENAFAYLPDVGTFAIVVYSWKENRAWRATHTFFHFDPVWSNFNVSGVNFQWPEGIFGLAVGETLGDGSRPIYFHALSSTKEFTVSNRILQNETLATRTQNYYDYQLLGERSDNSQSTAEVYDTNNKVLFYTLLNQDAIGCWNTKRPYTPANQGLVDRDSETLQFANEIKLDANDNLWVLSNRMPLFLYKSINPNENNYRLLRGRTNELIQGTPCAPRKQKTNY